MAGVRTCTRCGINPCSNRKGKPGWCTTCKNQKLKTFNLAPASSRHPSSSNIAYTCSACGEYGEVSFTKLKRTNHSPCESCMYRLIYRQLIAENPNLQTLSHREAIATIRDCEFEIIDPAGQLLSDLDAALELNEIWTPLNVRCQICFARDRVSVLDLIARTDPDPVYCLSCAAHDLTAWVNDVFESHGLKREHIGYARHTDAVMSRCLTCRQPRSISLHGLLRGETPCIRCCGGIDPEAEHRVYIFHFPTLGVYKVGIANNEDRPYDRIRAHESRGGTLVALELAPNRIAARAVEEHVLGQVESYRLELSAKEFPQGGWTELWSDKAPTIDLRAAISSLEAQNAPSFSVIRELESYFIQHPLTIQEIARYSTLEEVDVDGFRVMVVGLSATPYEMRRQVRLARELSDHLGD